jgi:hypothetical protein
MDTVIKHFYKKRDSYAKENQINIENKRKMYINEMDKTRRMLALTISLLVQLKFQLESEKPNTNNIKTWNYIKDIVTRISSRVNKSCYCVYRSPSRCSVNIDLVKIISNTPVISNIKIGNCYDQFIVDNKTLYGKVNSENIDLHIYEDTIIQIPKNLIQLPEDSISIEYVDVFSSRSSRMYKYKGIDYGYLIRLQKILDLNMSIENIDTAISIGKLLISQ